MNREQKLAKNTAILGIGTAFSSVFSFFMVPLYSHWLSVADYGTYDVYSTYVSLLIPFLTLACGEAVFRFLLDCKEEKDYKRVLSSSWVIVLLGLAIGTVIAVIFFMIGEESHTISFVFFMVSSILYSQGCYIARGFRKPVTYTLANIIFLLVMAATVTYLVYFRQYGLSGILWGNAIGHLVAFIYISISCTLWRYISLAKPDKNEIKTIIKYSYPLIPNTVAWWVVNVSDRSIIRLALGAASNGIYAIANKLPSLCITVFGVFHMSWQESAVDSVNDSDRNEYFNSVLNRIIPFCLSVGMCIIAVNRFFYKWVWDSKYIDGYFHVSILMVAVIFSFLSQFIGGVLVAEKKTKINGSTTVIAAFINIGVNVSLIHFIGLYSASVSTLAAYISLFIMRVYLIRKEFTISISRNSVMAIVAFICITITQFMTNVYVGGAVLIGAVFVSLLLNKAIVMGILHRILRRG